MLKPLEALLPWELDGITYNRQTTDIRTDIANILIGLGANSVLS